MRTSRSGCLMLFALPFAAVGAGMTWWLWSTIGANLAMRGWVPAPAIIVRTNLEVHQGGKGGPTYAVTAQYEYEYRGRSYTGHRVSLYSGSDNLGSFHRELYRQLSQCQKSHQPFPCYVDPARPHESILYRNLRWPMLAMQLAFALTFGGAGFGLLAGSMANYRRSRADAAQAAAHPAEPWLQKADWARGQATASNWTALMVWLTLALYWNLVALPLYLMLPGEILGPGMRYALIALIVPAGGLGLIAGAMAALRRWRKFGQSVFQMAAVPGLVGGQLAGVIRTTCKVLPQDGFRLTLRCVQTIVTNSGRDNSGTRENLLWEDDQVVARDLLQTDPDHSAIPVLFAIPYECRPTDETVANNQTRWRLAVQAKMPGLDYRAAFDVPVFKTDQSDPDFKADPDTTAAYAAPPDPDRDLREAGVLKAPAPGGEGYEFTFPMCRRLDLPLGCGLFTAFWTGIVVVLFCVKAPLLFPIAFGLLDVLLLLAVADLCFYRSVVEASPGGLLLRGGWFGLGRTRRLEAADVAHIKTAMGMQSGQAVYYNIIVTNRNGKKFTAAKNVFSHRLATAVTAQIQQALHRTP